MNKAYIELLRLNINVPTNIDEFIKSNETKVSNGKLYYKNIPEGLYLLMNQELKKINKKLDNFGTMIDLSRGAVFKVSYIKELIYKHALMGLNQLWMYMEDTYTLDNYPNFGYLRGRYSKEEIKEIVSYAKIFGIEVIPAIQTLGHQEQFLKWAGSDLRDQSDVLLINSKHTYEFIEHMLKWLYDAFDTDTVHLGLDETFGLGFGNFYKQNGYHDPIDIFNIHLNKVVEIANKIGFKHHLIWSDMYFRFLSKTNNYYDKNIVLDEKLINNIPKSVKLVYWDYYNHDEKIVDALLKTHLDTKLDVIFASGTWIWTKFTYDKTQTDKTALMHLDKTIEKGLKSFILTQWLDDGAYGNHETTILGVYEISQKLYNNQIDPSKFKDITGYDYDILLNKTKINDLSLDIVGLLWDDPLIGLYLNAFTNHDNNQFNKYINEYKELSDNLKIVNKNSIEALYTEIGSYKLLSRFYLVNEYKTLDKIKTPIKYYKKYIKLLDKLIGQYRKMWYKNYKLNGFEIIESRLATQIYRAKEAIQVIKEYNQGKLKSIDLLDDLKSNINYIYPKHSFIASSTLIK